MKVFALSLARLCVVIISAVILAGCASSRRSEPLRGPLTETNAEIVHGREVFMMNCNKCHPQGEAGLGPALNNKGYVPSFMIRFQVRHGLGVMPAFSDEIISPRDLDDLIEYLKAVRKKG